MDSLRVAVIGIGHLGARHLETLAKLKGIVKLAGICDSDPSKTAQPAKNFKIPVFTNYRDLAGKVDAVHICVPTSKHHEIARFFLGQSVHTFIEKPMTLTVAEADELIELADRHNVKLQVGHVERFNSAFMAIRHLCKEPLFIECHRLNRFPNRSLDIGVVMDLMIHDIDIMLGLNNCGVKDFHAVGVPVLTTHEDIANARIIFENGCVCNLTASRVSDEVVRKIRIFLKDTYISLDYVKQEAWIYKKHGMKISKDALPIEKEEPLKQEITSFIDCIRKDDTPLVSGREGREALKLALAICESIKDFGAEEKLLV